MPVLALWGDAGLPSRLPVLDIWRRCADDVHGQPIPNCGHFLPEEQPDQVAQLLLAFLKS
jgi:haloacetate dehalogenase